MNLIAIIYLLPVIMVSSSSHDPTVSRLASESSSAIDCEVRTVVMNDGSNSDCVGYKCVIYSNDEKGEEVGMVYDLPEFLIEQYRGALVSQPTSYIRIESGRIISAASQDATYLRSSTPVRLDELSVDRASKVEFSDVPFHWSNRRQLAAPAKSGVNSALFVRVTTNDATVSLDAETISNRVFGASGTLASVYSDCSFGKLKITKAAGSGITNGVVELFVNINIQNSEIRSLENTMYTALRSMIGSLDQFDHIAYCVPKGSVMGENQSGWVAYAYVSWHRSVFNDEQCGYLSGIVHEIGHNLGLGHSGDANSYYGDQSGYMGYAYDRVSWPVQCFNSAKNFQLGWYRDKSVIISVEEQKWEGKLYGYVDYESADGAVLLQVGELYLQYNKLAYINRDTQQKQNQIAITKSTGVDNSKSVSLVGLDLSHPIYTVENFTGNRNLVIEVCDHIQAPNEIDYFTLSIRFNDQPSKPTTSPTSDPFPRVAPIMTSKPTFAPTPDPTYVVTAAHTIPPTIARAKPPTVAPMHLLTLFPTEQPETPVPSTAAPTLRKPPKISPFPPGTRTYSPRPTSLPSSEQICDDDPWETFPTDEVNGFKRCIWLAARLDWQKKLCVESHPAYKICEETCGRCQDDCYDTDGKFEYHGIQRPCSWLALRFFVQNKVCLQDHEARAMAICPETCGHCDGELA